ncbi:MAG: hypothetical protein ACPGXY_03120 [Alphaproteobacteria bacterium]
MNEKRKNRFVSFMVAMNTTKTWSAIFALLGIASFFYTLYLASSHPEMDSAIITSALVASGTLSGLCMAAFEKRRKVNDDDS